jgi:competence protein ComGC
MNKLKNEEGYALVTVLLIITIFMVLFLSFAGQSFSTVKQNQVVEKKSQAVALAEMGVTYFQSLVNNIYLSKKNNEVRLEIAQYMGTHPGRTDAEYKEKAIEIMKSAILSGLNERKQEFIGANTSNPFVVPVNDVTGGTFQIEITPPPLGTPNDAVYLPFKITGNDNGKTNGKTSILTGTMKINVVVSPASSSSVPVTVTEKVFPTLNNLIAPVVTDTDCINAGIIHDKCTNTLLKDNSSGQIDGNNNGENNKTVFSTVPLYISGNGNHMKNVDFLSTSTGVMTYGSNIKHVEDITIKTMGSITFDLHFEPNASILYAMGSITANAKFSLYNGSFAYVAGNVRLTGSQPRIIKNNSTLCVKGNVTTDGSEPFTLSEGGQLIVHGTINGVPTPYTGEVNESKFLEVCGSSVTRNFIPPTIEWGNNISREVEYEH